MSYLRQFVTFLIGTYAKFGTSANLVREVSISVLTAAAVALLVQLITGFLTPAPSPVSEVRALVTDLLRTQHRADSIVAAAERHSLTDRIDSLYLVIHQCDEQDSLRANAGLSDLDAMRKINGAIAADRERTKK